MKWLLPILAASALCACATTAGPFVTGISSDGADGLLVEKCHIRFDPWMGTVGNNDCTNSTIKVRSAQVPTK